MKCALLYCETVLLAIVCITCHRLWRELQSTIVSLQYIELQFKQILLLCQ